MSPSPPASRGALIAHRALLPKMYVLYIMFMCLCLGIHHSSFCLCLQWRREYGVIITTLHVLSLHTRVRQHAHSGRVVGVCARPVTQPTASAVVYKQNRSSYIVNAMCYSSSEQIYVKKRASAFSSVRSLSITVYTYAHRNVQQTTSGLTLARRGSPLTGSSGSK